MTGQPEYLDTAAVAELLGVRPETVSRYRLADRHPRFPDPDLVISGRPAWRPDTIRAWAEARPGQGIGGGRHRRESGDGG